MTLYINCCIREDSRTDRLARALIKKLGDRTEEVRPAQMGLMPLTPEVLQKRERALRTGDHSDPMFDIAKQFAAADTVVIGAPYWDLSFPAALKVYLENIYVQGIVTRFEPDGTQTGLCRARKLWYVTTAGGKYVPAYGYGYVARLLDEAFGIRDAELVYAENLDLYGNDPEQILAGAMARYGLC